MVLEGLCPLTHQLFGLAQIFDVNVHRYKVTNITPHVLSSYDSTTFEIGISQSLQISPLTIVVPVFRSYDNANMHVHFQTFYLLYLKITNKFNHIFKIESNISSYFQIQIFRNHILCIFKIFIFHNIKKTTEFPYNLAFTSLVLKKSFRI